MNGLSKALGSLRSGLIGQNVKSCAAQPARFLAAKRAKSSEDEGTLAQEQLRSQQTVSPKLDDKNLRDFEDPWRAKVRGEGAARGEEMASGKLDKGPKGAGEVLTGSVEAMAAGVPLHREVVCVHTQWRRV